jgi:hypothetical protein
LMIMNKRRNRGDLFLIFILNLYLKL